MIKCVYYLLHQINPDVEPFDARHGTHNLYDNTKRTAFVFDDATCDYSDCSEIYHVMTDERAPYIRHRNYYIDSSVNMMENARRLLDWAGYDLTQISSGDEEWVDVFFLKKTNEINKQYETNIQMCMAENDRIFFPQNGFNRFMLENWFRMMPDHFQVFYDYNGKECCVLNDAEAFGDWGYYYSAWVKMQSVVGEGKKNTIDYYNEILHNWISEQRTAFVRGYLKKERYELLKKAGFQFNMFVESWEKNYRLLVEYSEKYGSVSPRKDLKYKDTQLGEWCVTQRGDYKKKRLAQDRVEKLDAIGFVWDPKKDEWNRKFEVLKQYFIDNNTTHISRRTVINGEKIGVWFNIQIKNYRLGQLLNERKEKLLALGVDLDNPHIS